MFLVPLVKPLTFLSVTCYAGIYWGIWQQLMVRWFCGMVSSRQTHILEMFSLTKEARQVNHNWIAGVLRCLLPSCYWNLVTQSSTWDLHTLTIWLIITIHPHQVVQILPLIYNVFPFSSLTWVTDLEWFQVALLDYGQVKELNDDIRLSFARFIVAYSANNIPEIGRSFK